MTTGNILYPNPYTLLPTPCTVHTKVMPLLLRSNCAENIRKHILHTGKHEGVMMYNCPRCDFATNSPSEFRNHLKDKHRDIENPDLAYLHAGTTLPYSLHPSITGCLFIYTLPVCTFTFIYLSIRKVHDE